MYKKLGLVGIFAGVLLTTSVANAIPVTDTIDQNIFLDTGDSYSYTHNLLDDGFNLGTAKSGTIDIQFTDDRDSAWEVISIVVDAFDFDTGGLSISSSARSYSSALEVNALAEVNSSGMLDITISSLWGDFYIGQSILTVESIGGGSILASDTNSVPEPGVLGMLAIGLLGIGVAGRRAKN